MPALLTISLISSLVISVKPNAFSKKYIPSTKAIITIRNYKEERGGTEGLSVYVI